MGRMESGGIELRGEAGRSNSSGQPFFRTSSWVGGISFLFFSKSWTSDNICCRNFLNYFLCNTPSAIIGAFISYGPFTLSFYYFFLVDIYSFCVLGGGGLARQIPIFFGFFTFSRAKSSMIVFLFLFLFFLLFFPHKQAKQAWWLATYNKKHLQELDGIFSSFFFALLGLFAYVHTEYIYGYRGGSKGECLWNYGIGFYIYIIIGNHGDLSIKEIDYIG